MRDVAPFGVCAFDHGVFVFQIFLKDRGIDKEIQFSVNDIGISHIAVELFANKNPKSAKAAKLGKIAGRIRIKALLCFGCAKIIVHAIMAGGKSRVADGRRAPLEREETKGFSWCFLFFEGERHGHARSGRAR